VAYGGKVHTAREMTESIQDSSRGFRFITGDQREKLAAKSAEFIGQSHESPWLLVSSFMNPHDICYMAIEDMADKPLESMGYHARLGAGPLHAAMRNPEGVSDEEFFARHCPPAPSNLEVPPEEPEMYKNLFARREFRKWARENWSEKRWRRYRWAYGNLTERVDGHIGRVLQALRRSGQAENTIVVFTSDHGDMDAAHRLEHKTVPYEEAARIPLLINDGRRPGGTSVNSRLVSNGLDLFPTLCDYAGIDAPPELKGYSLRPLCEGRRPRKWRDHLVVQTRVGRMLRTERHKYIICKKGKHREQLVDLKNDPGEMRNLVGDAAHGDVLTQHRRMLWQWVQKNNDKTAQEYLVRPV
jgi:choline-sulfatase